MTHAAGSIVRLDSKIGRVRAELRVEVARLDAKAGWHFRWIVGLLVPVTVGVRAALEHNVVTL